MVSNVQALVNEVRNFHIILHKQLITSRIIWTLLGTYVDSCRKNFHFIDDIKILCLPLLLALVFWISKMWSFQLTSLLFPIILTIPQAFGCSQTFGILGQAHFVHNHLRPVHFTDKVGKVPEMHRLPPPLQLFISL